jgi:hypothetical protein
LAQEVVGLSQPDDALPIQKGQDELRRLLDELAEKLKNLVREEGFR